MVESTNTNRCPNGTYLGWWGGYKCHVIISGTKYEWNTSEGVRGFNCRQIIKVTGGKASFDPSETWEPNQVPELDFKYIKVVYTVYTSLGLEILSKWEYGTKYYYGQIYSVVKNKIKIVYTTRTFYSDEDAEAFTRKIYNTMREEFGLPNTNYFNQELLNSNLNRKL